MSDKVDYLSQSDEDFANEMPPPVEASSGSQSDNSSTQDNQASQSNTHTETTSASGDAGTGTDASVNTGANADDGGTGSGAASNGGSNTSASAEQSQENADGAPVIYTPGTVVDTDAVDADKNKSAATDKPNGDVGNGNTASQQSAVVDYKTAYEQIMAPFKANGKTIELRSIEEAKSLMQMGANYTRKMQDIAPHRKILLMLENNGLLDESKLSFYIDLDKKNPEAIKKLVAESGIDPLEIDTSVPTKYQASNHSVTDQELSFRNTLDEVCASPEGQQTVALINSTWDQASKEQLWKDPSLISVFHQQRENGIYARITSEVERLKALGQIPVGTSFLSAYKLVGDHLHASNAFADLVKPSPSNQAVNAPAAPTPVAVKTVTPKAPVVNPAVAAASTPRSTPKRAQAIVNPLSVSDEDFMKNYEQFRNRV